MLLPISKLSSKMSLTFGRESRGSLWSSRRGRWKLRLSRCGSGSVSWSGNAKGRVKVVEQKRRWSLRKEVVRDLY